MPDIYLIGDTIRFTAAIRDLDGEIQNPGEITVSVFSAAGEELLASQPAIKDGAGSYHYDWEIQGIIDKSNLIVVWDWSGPHKKRMKFKVIPETE